MGDDTETAAFNRPFDEAALAEAFDERTPGQPLSEMNGKAFADVAADAEQGTDSGLDPPGCASFEDSGNQPDAVACSPPPLNAFESQRQWLREVASSD